jgi:hypothetical protein
MKNPVFKLISATHEEIFYKKSWPQKKKKGQKGQSEVQNSSADEKKKAINKNCWGAPVYLRDSQTRGAPWDFSHLVIWPVRP